MLNELRLAGISDRERANDFLPTFIARSNARFAKAPLRPDNLHRSLNVEPDRLRDILCLSPSRDLASQGPAGQWTSDMSATS